jgi:hypothetical protein
VGINNTGAAPAASALLDVTSSTKGVLHPRMNSTEMNAIASPAAGLQVYNTDSVATCYYTGTKWIKYITADSDNSIYVKNGEIKEDIRTVTVPNASELNFRFKTVNSRNWQYRDGFFQAQLVTSDDRKPFFRAEYFGTEDLKTPVIATMRGRGTIAAQTGLLAGDIVGELWFQAITSPTTFASSAGALRARATGNYTSTSAPTALDFTTTQVGTLASNVSATLGSNGYLGVGIGTEAPVTKIHMRSEGNTDTRAYFFSQSWIAGPVGPAPGVFTTQARGTAANSLNLVANDNVFLIQSFGYVAGAPQRLFSLEAQYVGNGNTTDSRAFVTVGGKSRLVFEANNDVLLSSNIAGGFVQSFAPLELNGANLGKPGINFANSYITTGNFVNINASAIAATSFYGNYYPPSDKTLKKDIKGLKYGLKEVMQLQPASYQYISGEDRTTFGFMAQDVKALMPEIVGITPTGQNKGTLNVDYNSIIPVLTKSIQEQQKQIEAQEQQNKLQQQQIEKLIIELQAIKNK